MASTPNLPKLNSLWSSPSFFFTKASQAADKQGFTLTRLSNNDDGMDLGCSFYGCPFRLELRPYTVGKFRVDGACHIHSHEVMHPVASTAAVRFTPSRTANTPTAPDDILFHLPSLPELEGSTIIPPNLPPWDYPLLASGGKVGATIDPVRTTNEVAGPSSLPGTGGSQLRHQGSKSSLRSGRGSLRSLLARPFSPSPSSSSSSGRVPLTRTLSGKSGVMIYDVESLHSSNSISSRSFRSASSSQSVTPSTVPTTPATLAGSQDRLPLSTDDKWGAQDPLIRFRDISIHDGEEVIHFAPIEPRIRASFDDPPQTASSTSTAPSSTRSGPTSQSIGDFLSEALPGGQLLIHEKSFKNAGVTTVLPLLALDDAECREFLANDVEPPIEKLHMRLIVSAVKKLRRSLEEEDEDELDAERRFMMGKTFGTE